MALFPSTVLSDEEAIAFLGTALQNNGKTTLVSKTAASISAVFADIFRTIIALSTQSTCTFTLPTPAQIVAGLSNPVAGSSFEFVIQNNNSGTATVAGNGCTIQGTATIPTTKTQIFRAVVTNANVGSEAVTVVALLNAAQ
ncbi:MAG TPA: hypothetical protein VKT73_15155 [Xanthobacteraceae bacterium]|nr:hypothetical protein [Xanthobacteraceae bacterium]